MTAIDKSRTVAVVGTGTMGQGIAQAALVPGRPVRFYDAVPGRAAEAAEAIDTAMRLGVNYPAGTLERGGRVGFQWACDLPGALHDRYPTGRCAPSLGSVRRAFPEDEGDN